MKCVYWGMTLKEALNIYPDLEVILPDYKLYHLLSLIPGVILTCFRNNGGKISDLEIKMAIERGKKIPGGSCAYMGVCGVTVGVSIALSVILKASPLKRDERTVVLKVASELNKKIAEYNAARCCQRESITGLRYFSKISKDLISIYIPADSPFKCNQYTLNKTCIGKRCPYHPKNIVKD
jgi:hypothetical protein